MELKTEGACDLSYQKEAHISWKKPEGGQKLVILNLRDGDFFSLEDRVSIEIWEQLMDGKPAAAILDKLRCDYPGVTSEALAKDMDGFIADLVENKLICRRPQNGMLV